MSDPIGLLVVALMSLGFGVFVVVQREGLARRIVSASGNEWGARSTRTLTAWTGIVGGVCILFSLVWGVIAVILAVT
jgi:hypothetical protein